MGETGVGGRAGWIALAAAATAIGAVLRIAGLDQSLYGDELFTYAIATRDGLGGVFDGIDATENTPPLVYVLAWLTADIGDPAISVRLPSLVLGTAAIPAVYLLGTRVGGRRAGALAALLMALAPFAIFYSTEARAYAALLCLVPLSTAALLAALDGGGRSRWALFWLASTLALYAHYTAVLPLAAQAAWALWRCRDQLRTVLPWHAAVAVAYVPWLPSVGENEHSGAIAASYEQSLESFVRALPRVFPGFPFQRPTEVPGGAALALLAVGGALGAVALARGRRAGAEASAAGGEGGPVGGGPVDGGPVGGGPVGGGTRPGGGGAAGARPRAAAARDRVVLLAAMAASTPVGLAVYGAIGTDLYAPRNLAASLPAALVLISLPAAVPSRAALAAAALLAAAPAIGAVQMLDRDNERPAFRQVAERIDAAAGREDRVVESPLLLARIAPDSPLQRHLLVQLDEPHRHFRVVSSEEHAGGIRLLTDRAAWAPAPTGRQVFVVGFEHAPEFQMPAPPAGSRFRETDRRVLPGLVPLTLVRYVAAP